MHKKILQLVTVTGADDSINPGDLCGIAEQYPYVEFGILLSDKYSLKNGAGRFPSLMWLNHLVAVARRSKLHLCGHICGRWTREALKGQFVDLDTVAPGLQSIFQRFQLNTHAVPHTSDVAAVGANLVELSKRSQSCIFQLDGVNGETLAQSLMGHSNIAGLFDLSHGAGILPKTWPPPIPGIFCGYAGGLFPHNLSEQLVKIEALVGDTPIWIDAETGVRTDDDRRFDFKRVKTFLEKAKPWVKDE